MLWFPAYAGMTVRVLGVTVKAVGNDGEGC